LVKNVPDIFRIKSNVLSPLNGPGRLNAVDALQRNFDYVFPEKELRGLSPNFHIHVSVSDLYIPVVGPPIFLQQNMQTDRGNIQIAHRNMNVWLKFYPQVSPHVGRRI
jgi:hypothetical protein